jgi:CheY-like chemotaxis protein
MTPYLPVICLIEDDTFQVFLLEKMIELTGIPTTTIVFKNGKEAFENLKERYHDGKLIPDVVFLDINMPIWDGWEFLAEMKKHQIPIGKELFILTSSLSLDDQQKANSYNLSNRYLSKPLTKDKLKEILSAL